MEMARIEASRVINRPVEDVFAYVTDERNMPKWESYILEVEQTSTRLTIVGEGETGGSFTMAEPIVVPMFQREVQANLARLKDILEAETADKG